MPRKTRKTSRNIEKPTAKSRLTPLQIRAIELLATGDRKVVVAEQLDIPISTIYSWFSKADFLEALDELINASSEEAFRHLRSLKIKAVTALQKLLDDPDTPAAVQMQVAFRILEVPSPAVAPTNDPEIAEDVLQRIREQVYGIFPDFKGDDS